MNFLFGFSKLKKSSEKWCFFQLTKFYFKRFRSNLTEKKLKIFSFKSQRQEFIENMPPILSSMQNWMCSPHYNSPDFVSQEQEATRAKKKPLVEPRPIGIFIKKEE
jgi:hypothetical protein